MSETLLASAASQIDFKPIAKWFTSRLSKIVQSLRNDAKATNPETYALYFRNCYEWASQATSLAFPKGPVPLHRFWVPLMLETPSGKEVPATLLAIEHESALIVGTGGSGKTTIIRSLYLDAFPTETENTHTTPFIFHLNRFDPDRHVSLPQFMCDQLRVDGIELDPEAIFRYLNARAAIVFFDGFDEIAPSGRAKFRERFMTMRRSLHAPLRTIITTRDTGDLQDWDPIHRYAVKPMSFEAATQLVDKIGPEVLGPSVFAAFRIRWNEETFNRAQGFADNPLLLTLMIMVFEDGKELEPLATDFPDDVFNTMWRRHRAHGAGEGRQRRTTMPKLAFRDVLDRFSLLGYLKGQIAWTEDGVMRLAKEALELQGFSGDEHENFVIDLVEVVCMMIKDGEEYRFAHRSLQDFFAASKIAKSASIGDLRAKLLEDPSDNVPRILCTLVRDRMIHDVLIPELEHAYDTLTGDDDTLRERIWAKHLANVEACHFNLNGVQLKELGWINRFSLFELCRICTDSPRPQLAASIDSHLDAICAAIGIQRPADPDVWIIVPKSWLKKHPPEMKGLIDQLFWGGPLSSMITYILKMRTIAKTNCSR